MTQKVLAIGAHPDDIEFMMAGTLLQLGKVGYEPHVFVVANGSCGSMVMDRDELVRVRFDEARAAAAILGAEFHAPIADDLEITYTLPLLRKAAAVIRAVEPDIVLTHSPDEYMEDHNATCRLAITATFARGMRNFRTDPDARPFAKDTVLYHSLPYGLADSMGRRVVADCYVDIEDALERKTRALACHESQKNWLDESQGLDSYLHTMQEMSREMGEASGKFTVAEGWRRHNHLGFASREHNPLVEALGTKVVGSRMPG